MSIFRFLLPDIGEGLQEAEIVSWLVSAQDHVVEDQPIVSVETDKALVEIPSPVSGTVSGLFGQPGDIIKVGALLAEIETGRDTDTGTVVGDLPSLAGAVSPGTPASANQSPAGSGIMASPAVRAEARRRGIDLSSVTGTGKQGSITMTDLGQQAAPPADAESLSGLRRSMFKNMSRAGQEVVTATLTARADIDSWKEEESLMARLALAIIQACKTEPALNCSLDASKQQRIYNRHVNLGIATDTREGLLVPTLVNADSLPPEELDRHINQLLEQARQRKTSPAELKGQTISLSNFGTIAGDYAQMVVIPPQVAIIGAGTIRPEPVACGTGIEIHRLLPLSISFDHRAVTGGEAARFMKALVDSLEREQATQH